MKLHVFGYLKRSDVQAELLRVKPLLDQHRVLCQIDLAEPAPQPIEQADLALVFGGDGTILRAAHVMGQQQMPTLGINLGKLGFLADVRQNVAIDVLSHLLKNGFEVTDHLMLQCQVSSPGGTQQLLGLNEMVVHADPPLQLIHIDLMIDNEPVATFAGDGLIISTPMGSTGHSLSAGGPILRQELPAFVITPICAHTLTNRPIVDSAERTYEIALHPGSNPAVLSIDGQVLLPITPQHRIIVSQASVKFRKVRVPGRSYYSTLRDKLHWAVHPHEKS